MNDLEHPSEELWKARRHWFEQLSESMAGEASYVVSEKACALIDEVHEAFCAGKWVSVLVLSMATIDAQLLETELPGFKGYTRKVLDAALANPELQRLRERINSIIHISHEAPAITGDQQWANRIQLEQEARNAVGLMFQAVYISPGV